MFVRVSGTGSTKMVYIEAAQNEIEQKQITTLKQKQLNYSTENEKVYWVRNIEKEKQNKI